MNADLLTLILLVFSTLILVVAETHVAFVTFALCGGFVLAEFIGIDLYLFAEKYISSDTFPLQPAIELFLIFLPALLIGHRFRRSQRGTSRYIQQFVPAFALSLLVVVFVFNTLPLDAQQTLRDTSYFHSNLESVKGWLVLFAVASAMFDVLIQHAGPPRKYKKRRGKHKE